MEENPNSSNQQPQDPNPEIELDQTPPQPDETPPQTPPADTEQPPQPEQPAEPDNDSKLWATFCHLSAFCGCLGVPFGNILGPLIIWLIKKDTMPYVDQNGKEAVNFQISMVIYFLAAFPLICGGPLIFIVWLPLVVLQVIFTIIATIKANQGETYRYPMSIRFIK